MPKSFVNFSFVLLVVLVRVESVEDTIALNDSVNGFNGWGFNNGAVRVERGINSIIAQVTIKSF